MKKVASLLLAGLMGAGTLFGLTACGNNDGSTSGEITDWNLQTVYAKAQELGYGGTLEEFLATIKGKDGEQGIPGLQGEAGVGIKNVYVDTEGHLVVMLDSGKKIDCGQIITESGMVTPIESVREELYQAIDQLSVGGFTFKGDMDYNGYTDISTVYGAFSLANGQITGDFQNLEMEIDEDDYDDSEVWYDVMYIREEDAYQGEYDFVEGYGEYADEGAAITTVDEYLAALQNGDEYLIKADDISLIDMIEYFLGKNAPKQLLKNLARAINSKVEITGDGYKLVYTLDGVLNQLFDMAGDVMTAIEKDKSMTVIELLEVPSVNDFVTTLLYGIEPTEIDAILRELAPKSVIDKRDEYFPEVKEEYTAYSYLKACLNSPKLGKFATGKEKALGSYVAYDLIADAMYQMDVSSIPDALLPSIAEKWENTREMLMKQITSSFGLGSRYAEVELSLALNFDMDKKATGVSLDYLVEESNPHYYGTLYRKTNVEIEFLDVAPTLTDLTGYEYISGVTCENATLSQKLSGARVNATRFEWSVYAYGNYGEIYTLKLNSATGEYFAVDDYGYPIVYCTAEETYEDLNTKDMTYYDETLDQWVSYQSAWEAAEYGYYLFATYDGDMGIYYLEPDYDAMVATFYVVAPTTSGYTVTNEVSYDLRAEENRYYATVYVDLDASIKIQDGAVTVTVGYNDQVGLSASEALDLETPSFSISLGGYGKADRYVPEDSYPIEYKDENGEYIVFIEETVSVYVYNEYIEVCYYDVNNNRQSVVLETGFTYQTTAIK